jgi:lipopolysaccharide export system protein LptA
MPLAATTSLRALSAALKSLFMKQTFSGAILLSLALMLPAGVATAEKADQNKPMNVEADALRYDDLKQTSVFTGRVVLTKGTIVIRGARVDVRQDPEGYQYGVVTAEPGKLAFYRQKREGVDEFIEGEGETIEYDGKADRVKFVKHAELRRYRGATVSDEMVGSLITYDNGTDVFTVDAGPTSPAVGGRVRAVISPRPAASAPGAAPVQPPIQLRPSTSLDGGKK